MITALLILTLFALSTGLVGFITFSLDMGFFWWVFIVGDGISYFLQGIAAVLVAIGEINS